MDSIVNFLGDLGTSLVLIAIVGAHILEEVFASYKPAGGTGRLRGFRRFFNLEWFQTGRENFPVTKFKAIVIDQVGLFMVLTLLSLLALLPGTFWPNLIWVAVGFITADLIQHGLFSIGRRKYSPGVSTSALYLIFIVYFFRTELGGVNENVNPLLPLAIGTAGLLSNYILASRKVRKWRQSREPVPA